MAFRHTLRLNSPLHIARYGAQEMTMTTAPSFTGLQLRSQATSASTLVLSLASVTQPAPGPDDVVVRIEASPINPSDIGLLFGPADISAAQVSGTGAATTATAPIAERFMKALAGRLNQALPVGSLPENWENTGRNASCPCGSGKKFKHCHGALV